MNEPITKHLRYSGDYKSIWEYVFLHYLEIHIHILNDLFINR